MNLNVVQEVYFLLNYLDTDMTLSYALHLTVSALCFIIFLFNLYVKVYEGVSTNRSVENA